MNAYQLLSFINSLLTQQYLTVHDIIISAAWAQSYKYMYFFGGSYTRYFTLAMNIADFFFYHFYHYGHYTALLLSALHHKDCLKLY